MLKIRLGPIKIIGISASAVIILLTSMGASSVGVGTSNITATQEYTQNETAQLLQRFRERFRERFRLRERFNQRQRNENSEAGAVRDSIDVNGKKRNYYLVSNSKSQSSNAPLLIVLHGGGGSAKSVMRVTQIGELGKSNGFDVVFPEGSNLGHPFRWNNGMKTNTSIDYIDDISFIDKIVQRFTSQDRPVFLAGLSNGGMMALRQLCDGQSQFNGAFIVAGSTSQEILNSCTPKASLPILLVHGKEDSIVPYQGGLIVHPNKSKPKNPSTTPVVAHKSLVDFWRQKNQCNNQSLGLIKQLSVKSDSTVNVQNFIRPIGNCKQTISIVMNQGEHGWPIDASLLSTREKNQLEMRRRIAGRITGKDSLNPGNLDISGFITKLMSRWTKSPYS